MTANDKVTDKSLSNTGERMIPAYSQAELVYGEHIVRYESAKDIVANKVVLDIASGSGYGTAILGESAKRVVGVDIDAGSIKYAQKNYGSKNVTFKRGDGKNIPLANNSVEVVVSYETIEHIDDYKGFMAEVKRVLKPGGLFILSTPNDLEYPEGNHFHLHEFEPDELEKFAKQYFKNTKTYYQGTWLYNALVDKEILSKSTTQRIQTLQLAPIVPEKSVYLFLLCSDSEISAEVQPLAAISEHWSERTKVDYEIAIEKERSEHIRTIRRLEKLVDQKHEELLKALQELEQQKQTMTRAYKLKVKQYIKKLHDKKEATSTKGTKK